MEGSVFLNFLFCLLTFSQSDSLVLPMILTESLPTEMGWNPGDEIWLEVEYLASPQGPLLHSEPGEKLWWVQNRCFLLLGATGNRIPDNVLNRDKVWVRLSLMDQDLSDSPIALFPKQDKVRPGTDPLILGRSPGAGLGDLDATYLSQVSNFMAGNVGSLDIQGSSFSITGYGTVIASNGEWLGEPVAEEDPQVGNIIPNFLPRWNGLTLTTSSIFDDGNVSIGTNDPQNFKLRVAGSGRFDSSLQVDTHQVWHAGNDGASSGLDADTIDGHHASELISTTVGYYSRTCHWYYLGRSTSNWPGGLATSCTAPACDSGDQSLGSDCYPLNLQVVARDGISDVPALFYVIGICKRTCKSN